MKTFYKIIKPALVGLGFLACLSAAAQSNSWAQMPTPNPSPERNLLRGISGTSATDVWAVGDFQTSAAGAGSYTQEPLIIHWDGSSWTTYPVQTFGTFSSFWDVEAIAADNVWAVGDFAGGGGGAQTQIAHWEGTSWTNVHHNFPVAGSPWPNTAYLWSVDAISANNIWAVGGKGGVGADPCLAYHYNGSSWTDVPVPPVGQTRNRFTAVDGIAANDVWAVGSWGHVAGSFNYLAMHWDGTSWTSYPMPAGLTGNIGELLNVKMVASNDVWAVGDMTTGGLVVIHWDGTSWSQVSTNGAGAGGDLAVLGPDNMYAVGGWISHWDGASWTVTDSLSHLPYPSLIATTVLPNGEMWAAGRNIDFDNKFYTLIYRYSSNSGNLVVTTSSPTVPAGTQVQLQAQPTLAGNYTYRWSAMGGNPFSDPTVANPTVTPSATTTYAVNMTNAAGNSVQGWVKVEVSGMVGLAEAPEAAALAAWPNPFSDRVHVQVNVALQQEAHLMLTDALGRTVSTTTTLLQPGNNALQVQAVGQPAGVYLLRVQTAGEVWQARLVKQ